MDSVGGSAAMRLSRRWSAVAKGMWSSGATGRACKRRRGRTRTILLVLALALATCMLLASCAPQAQRTKVKVLIVPKFEIGEISGDYPGEAQLFYEHYLAGTEERPIPNATPSSHFYMNEESGVALLVTGSGKSAASLSLASLLAWDAYDFDDATIVSVGCAGGSTQTCVPGDLIVVTSACDADLGHRVDSQELKGSTYSHTWFADDSFLDYSFELLNAELCDKVYALLEDCPLRTTEASRDAMAKTYPGQEWAQRQPHVAKGTALTGDNYWKGEVGHANAELIVQHYQCPDPYAVTEMEDLAILNAAECFGLKDRVIALRVVVNMDTFLANESPESLWLGDDSFSDAAQEEDGETMDIFAPGMENLFDAGKIVVDSLLAGA